MDLGLKGKKALVCGGSKGIGRAIAEALAGEGAGVVICSRSAAKLEQVAGEIREKTGTEVDFACADLTDATDRAGMIEEVRQKSGAIDILVHNTGGPRPTAVLETGSDDWQAGFERLFQSIVQLNGAFIPSMRERRWGRILTVTSLTVLEPARNMAISNVMRSAVTSMMKTLADELAADNITVNCMAPGAISTERLDELMRARIEKSGQSKEEYQRQYLKAIPAGRLGTPAEFAHVAAFLCSEKASYVTGSTICVDGGKRRSL